MAKGEISWPDLKTESAVLLFGGRENRVGYADCKRVRTSICDSVNATAR
jgi:hypothetical protein